MACTSTTNKGKAQWIEDPTTVAAQVVCWTAVAPWIEAQQWQWPLWRLRFELKAAWVEAGMVAGLRIGSSKNIFKTL
jgi:hypothetical protein